MKVLVTGGAGFIGQHTIRQLQADGHSVVAFDRAGAALPPGVEHFLGDIRDADAITEAVAHAEGVIHLAGVLGTAETIDNPRPAANTNILGGLNVLEAVDQYKVPLVNIAVGNHWENNTYSISKSTVERFCTMFAKYRGTNVSVVRALNAWGPGQTVAAPYGSSKVRKIMPSFICRALSGAPIQVYADPEKGSSVMDMVHVTDVARVLTQTLYAALRNDAPFMDVIEAGTGRRTTVDDIAELVVAAVGQGEIEHLPMRRGETPGAEIVANTNSLIHIYPEVDVREFISLEDGLPETVEYFKAYLAERERQQLPMLTVGELVITPDEIRSRYGFTTN